MKGSVSDSVKENCIKVNIGDGIIQNNVRIKVNRKFIPDAVVQVGIFNIIYNLRLFNVRV